MTWKELKDKISLMTEEEQRQEVAVWGENMNLMKDCSLEKTDEDMYYNSEWDYTCEESELEPEDKNDPDVHKVYEAGMYYIYSKCTSKLFVDMIKSICNISEQVKSFINPEQIKAIAESNEPILLLSNN